MTTRQWWSGIAVLVAAIAVATFFLTRGSDDKTANADATTAPTTATPTTPTTATPSPTHSKPAGPFTCQSAHLKVKLVDDAGGGAAGSTYSHLTFTNIGSSSCRMTGWPGVSYYGGPDVAQLGSAADRQGTPSVITIAPHAVAQALLKESAAGNYEPGCIPAPADGLRVYSPNTTHYVLIPHATDACTAPSKHLLTIGPVRLK